MKEIFFITASLSIALSIIFSSCKKEYPVCPAVALEEGTLTAEETEIISTIISEFHPHALIHLVQQTYQDKDSLANINYVFFISQSDSLAIDTVLAAEFAKSNKMEGNFPDNGQFPLIHQNELDCMFSIGCEEGWKAWYKKYRNSAGFLKFSRPGISGDKAIIDYGMYFDCLGGMGYFVVLKKSGGKWVIENRINTWVS